MSERDSICAHAQKLVGGIRVRLSGNGFVLRQTAHRLTTAGWQFRMKANWFVVCDCECGNSCLIRVADLKRGEQQSCGCQKLEAIFETGHKNATHGQKGTRLYSIWSGMKVRCGNQNAPDYDRYGGRGVSVCDEWLSFEPFYEWALANGYSDDLTLDRFPNRSGNYKPSNCRWATMSQQMRNKDVTRAVRYRGEDVVLIDLCDRLGIVCATTAKARLKSGWSVERAVETPSRGHRTKGSTW